MAAASNDRADPGDPAHEGAPPDDDLERALAEHRAWLTAERGLAASSVAAYRRDLTRYADALRARGVTAVAAVDPGAVVDHVGALAATPGRAPASVARATAAIRSFHRFCAEEGLAPTDPAADVAAPPVPRALPKALTEAEVLALLAAPVGDGPLVARDVAVLELLYGTGARISELVGLDLADWDPASGFLRLFGKGSKERVVPVGGPAGDALDRWLAEGRPAVAPERWRRRGDAEAVFLNARGGRLGRQGCWGIVRAHGRRAGLDGRLWPHVLRHSCATHMVERGADLRVVQELLGHARISTTQVYTAVSPTRLAAVHRSAHPRAALPATPSPD